MLCCSPHECSIRSRLSIRSFFKPSLRLYKIMASSSAQLNETLGNIVGAALGPLPLVCQEKVLLDLERARMTAEESPYHY